MNKLDETHPDLSKPFQNKMIVNQYHGFSRFYLDGKILIFFSSLFLLKKDKRVRCM